MSNLVSFWITDSGPRPRRALAVHAAEGRCRVVHWLLGEFWDVLFECRIQRESEKEGLRLICTVDVSVQAIAQVLM